MLEANRYVRFSRTESVSLTLRTRMLLQVTGVKEKDQSYEHLSNIQMWNIYSILKTL